VSAWRPLLEGEAARTALQAVDEIAPGLARAVLADERADLADGAAGAALLFAALERAGRRPPELPSATTLLAHAVRRLRQAPLPPPLWGGTAGVVFALAGAVGRGASPAVLARLADWVRRGAGGEHDLISGVVGAGVLGLELGADPAAGELVATVVARLAATAHEPEGGGLAWASPRPDVLGVAPYNLGVAHGVPGVVGFLAGALRSPAPPGETRELLRGAARWVLAQRRDGDGSFLPYAVGPGPPPQAARLAWCYGDAGAAVTLLNAARALGDDDEIEQGARALAARAAARSPESAGVVDAGFCHGAAGLAHLHGRLWQLTGEDAHARAGRYWLTRTLELYEPRTAPGLLTGATGVALVLLAACETDDPGWDRAFLASPARPALSHSVAG
jgi:hypothetical protein